MEAWIARNRLPLTGMAVGLAALFMLLYAGREIRAGDVNVHYAPPSITLAPVSRGPKRKPAPPRIRIQDGRSRQPEIEKDLEAGFRDQVKRDRLVDP